MVVTVKGAVKPMVVKADRRPVDIRQIQITRQVNGFIAKAISVLHQGSKAREVRRAVYVEIVLILMVVIPIVGARAIPYIPIHALAVVDH